MEVNDEEEKKRKTAMGLIGVVGGSFCECAALLQ